MQIKLLTIFIIGFTLLTNAQKYTNSPFSSYGIGENGGLDHALFSGMGNTSLAIIDTTVLNFYNPSSYSSLGKGQPLFSTGISSRFSKYESGTESHNSRIIGLDHFALAIPFAKHFGLAVGLKPFSRTGYEFYQLESTSTLNMRYIYKGSGGTHEVFGGLAANLLNFKGHRLSVGTNLGYVFGTTLNERISYIDANYAEGDVIPGGIENKGFTMKSFHMDFGMNYQWKINDNQSMIVAALYTPKQNLTATRNEFLAYSVDVNNPNKYVLQDTAINEKGHIAMPSVIGLGFSYTLRPSKIDKRTKVYQLTLAGELKMTEWSGYETRFETISTGNFSNTIKIGVGAQFTPHYNYLDRANSVGYLSRIRYRAGFQYATLPLKVQNKQQTDLGITAGLGLPIAIQRSSSSVNIGLMVGKRGNGGGQSVNESYIGINFGVTISPGSNDRWFRKFKID